MNIGLAIKNFLASAEARQRIIGRLRLHVYYFRLSRFGRKSGVTTQPRAVPLIITLASIPRRLNTLHLVIASLMQQTILADQIVVWLPESCRDAVPQSLQRLQKRGLTIRFCNEVGPHKKLVYALDAFPNSLLVTADDDILYPDSWLAELYETYLHDPTALASHRAHAMRRDATGKLCAYDEWHYTAQGNVGPSHALLPTNGAGTLFFPGALHEDVTDQALFQSLAPHADDIWFKVMAFLNDTPVRKVSADSGLWLGNHILFGSGQLEGLTHLNVEAKMNDSQLANVLRYYGITETFGDETNL